jgi:alpha-D-xyloside xylohydrolase
MYGYRYLVAPVLAAERREMRVYLPAGATWKLWDGEKVHEGGQHVEVECPIDIMPVFIKQ